MDQFNFKVLVEYSEIFSLDRVQSKIDFLFSELV